MIINANNKFQIGIENNNIHLVKLRFCFLLLPKYYPLFTLLGQNIGSLVLSLEALIRCPPDLCIDTIGASFSYPIFRYLGVAKVCSYTHYPVVSVDMLNVVADNISTFNNREFIARSVILTKLKLFYYRIFSTMYKYCGKSAHNVMVNSSWTKNHIESIWERNAKIVYPPCNVSNLIKLNLNNKNRNSIISISQFRPEKNHELQLKSLAKLIELLDENGYKEKPLLIIIGSCRNEEDEELVMNLKQKCVELNIEDNVQFKVNINTDEMITLMEQSSIAIHTMVNEHFGISVVEFLAAGLLTLVHNSGGPKLDIIGENETGFLAETCDEFAQTLYKLILLPENDAKTIRNKARESIKKYSQENFEELFLEQISSLIN